MADFLELMLKPFIACLILTGMHAYLGLHVVERGVIFVDLALAQVAALGVTIGFLFGMGMHSTASYAISLAATLFGAGLFALTRHRRQRVPQEALIGVVYAVAAAACILVLSRSADGGEELRSLMVGHLLFIGWPEILKVFLLYAAVGLLHWFCRKQLLLISRDPEAAFATGLKVRWWDFVFYGSFGFVVTSSTEIAGVLLVFSFLVVPAICGVLLARSVAGRLLTGWLCGLLTSIVGIMASWFLDLPTGAAVVCCFGVSLLACYSWSALRPA